MGKGNTAYQEYVKMSQWLIDRTSPRGNVSEEDYGVVLTFFGNWAEEDVTAHIEDNLNTTVLGYRQNSGYRTALTDLSYGVKVVFDETPNS